MKNIIVSVLQSEGLTLSFILLIFLVLIVGLVLRFFTRPANKVVALLPSIATSLGILGTFIGIYTGLLSFDVKNINDSIPQLLEGLKTAFATSIAGMITSIILRFLFEGKSTYDESKENKGEVQTDDPILLLKNIASGIVSLEKSSREIERSIVSCFRSDEEFSLLFQLKLIRQEIIDTRRELNSSFKDFAKEMGKVNSDTLVEALKKVIDDFNILLNELVSDSFKELSIAMIKLTEWQENYKIHVDQSQDKINLLLEHIEKSVLIFRHTAQEIELVKNNLENIADSISNLSVSSNDIASHVSHLTIQNEALKESISSIKNIGEEAKTVIPTIKNQIDNLTKNLENAIYNTIDKMEHSNTSISEFVKKSTESINGATAGYTISVQDSMDRINKELEKTINNIDKELDKELNKALNSFIGALASLSEKFVKDYLPLTERLREVVRLSENIDV